VPLELVEVGTSAGVGIVDNVLVELEETGKITGNMKYVKDVLRIGGAFGGAALNYFAARPGTFLDKTTKAIVTSTIPLAMHSIRRIVKEALAKGYRGGYVLESRGPIIVSAPQTTQPSVQYVPAVSSAITSY
jgi:hypothetical protein